MVGLSIGMIFLVFFLKKKSGEGGFEICYFPNCRVLKDMRSKTLTFGDDLPEKYKDTLLIQRFLTDGDVDFGKSDTKSEPCKIYFLELEEDGKILELKVKNCKETLVVETIAPYN